MPGSVDDVDAAILITDRGVLGVDGDAALALLVVAVHDQFRHFLMCGECTALAQQSVDERRLAVVDVRDNGDIADLHGNGGRRGVARV